MTPDADDALDACRRCGASAQEPCDPDCPLREALLLAAAFDFDPDTDAPEETAP